MEGIDRQSEQMKLPLERLPFMNSVMWFLKLIKVFGVKFNYKYYLQTQLCQISKNRKAKFNK